MAIELRVEYFWSESILLSSNPTRGACSSDFKISRVYQTTLHSIPFTELPLLNKVVRNVRLTFWSWTLCCSFYGVTNIYLLTSFTCACSACLRVRFWLIVCENSRVKLWRFVPVSRIKALKLQQASFRLLHGTQRGAVKSTKRLKASRKRKKEMVESWQTIKIHWKRS